MTYDSVISWIRSKYDQEGYDIFSVDDVRRIRQQLISDYDQDGRLQSFLFGNDQFTRYMEGRKWGGVEGTSVERQLFEEVEEPIINELNRGIEQQALGQIQEADTTDDLDDVDIPDNLMPDVTERLESAKTDRFGELKGEELRREIEAPDTEVSRLIQLTREVRKLPDADNRAELEREIKEETERLKEINTLLLQEIRITSSQAELDNVINRIGDSDLRSKQKDALIRIAEARRGLGFPEISEV